MQSNILERCSAMTFLYVVNSQFIYEGKKCWITLKMHTHLQHTKKIVKHSIAKYERFGYQHLQTKWYKVPCEELKIT